MDCSDTIALLSGDYIAVFPVIEYGIKSMQICYSGKDIGVRELRE